MFGNKVGWIISAILTAGIFAIIFFVIVPLNAVASPSSGPVTMSPRVVLNLEETPAWLEPIALPVSPNTVYGGMTEEKDAAAIYRRAIDEYKANRKTYDYLFTGKNNAPLTYDLKMLPAIEMLIEARTASSMKLFSAAPEAVINIDDYVTPAQIDALRVLGKAASKLGLYMSVDKIQPENVKALGEAAFSLGAKMYEERVRYPEIEVGNELLHEGADLIARADPAKKDAVKTFRDALTKYQKERVFPLYVVISSADGNVIGRTVGDMFYIARHSKEKMWRVEAMLKLGRIKHDPGEPPNGANVRGAALYLKRVAANDKEDPTVRMAAELARDLTLEQFRSMRIQ
jgi:hypothetical protein